MKYRKKPVVIEAIQYDGTGESWEAIEDFMGEESDGLVMYGFNEDMQPSARYTAPAIKTLEGYMKVSVGDWIIKGVNGEFYPCKPDIFEKTYEPVN